MSRGVAASAACTDTWISTPGWSRTRRREATVEISDCGWRTGSSGMNTTSSAGPQRRMASTASRVLPAPPGPVKLINRESLSNSESSASSRSRPTKLVCATAIGPGGAAGPDGAVGPDGAAGPGAAVGPGAATCPGGVTGPGGAVGPGAATGPGGVTGPGAVVGPGGAAGSGAVADPRSWAAISASNSARARLARADIRVRPASHRFTVANDTPSRRASCSWLRPRLARK